MRMPRLLNRSFGLFATLPTAKRIHGPAESLALSRFNSSPKPPDGAARISRAINVTNEIPFLMIDSLRGGKAQVNVPASLSIVMMVSSSEWRKWNCQSVVDCDSRPISGLKDADTIGRSDQVGPIEDIQQRDPVCDFTQCGTWKFSDRLDRPGLREAAIPNRQSPRAIRCYRAHPG